MISLIITTGRGLRRQRGLCQLLSTGGKAVSQRQRKKRGFGGAELWHYPCGFLREPQQVSKTFVFIPQPSSSGQHCGGLVCPPTQLPGD